VPPPFNICTDFGIDYDIKFNDTKSVVMRIGPRCNALGRSLELAENLWIRSTILGYTVLLVFILDVHLRLLQLKFFSVFNCIYAKRKATG